MHPTTRLLCALAAAAAVLLPACIEPPPDNTPKCALAADDPLREAVETLCDGVDNDCDGLTDTLLPVAVNACAGGPKGACGQGYVACLGGARTCLLPPPVAESLNGLDDDCDGQTDDVEPAPARPLRARVLVPPYIWQESSSLRDHLVEVLQQAGVPHTAVAADAPDKELDWVSGFTELGQYAVVVVPGYTMGWEIDAGQLAKLKAWVEQGGVLVWSKPIGPDPAKPAEEQQPLQAVLDLAGLKSATQHLAATHVDVEASVPAALHFDSVAEREVLLNGDPKTGSAELFTYELAPGSGSQVFGKARAGDQVLGNALIRRQLGQGAVYTLGFEPLEAGSARCYINCFDPGRDWHGLLLRAVLREAGRGHYAVKHTVPGPQQSVMLLTHDIDAPDSHNDAPAWGKAGAVRCAEVEKQAGVAGTYFVTTDYHDGYYAPDLSGRLCALGMCPDAGHSVRHLDMSALPMGNCQAKSYDPAKPTVCGEVLSNLGILQGKLPAGEAIRGWRSPYLKPHDGIFPILASQGIWYDSSFSIGDLRSNFPVAMTRTSFLKQAAQGQPLFTFPIVQEDGIGSFVDGKEVRLEMQEAHRDRFLHLWQDSFLHNHRNGAWNVVLLHPSYGVGGVGPENLAVKIDIFREFLQFATQHDIVVDRIGPLGDFWRGRDAAELKVAWNPALPGYDGEITAGALPAPRFSLEFGDAIASFEAAGVQAQVTGRRVVLPQGLQPGQKVSFQARVQ